MSPSPVDRTVETMREPFDLGNGLEVIATDTHWVSENEMVLAVSYRATSSPAHDYSVAVHLVAADPPVGSDDILSQDDKAHPIDNWYPTSGWEMGQVVADTYLVTVPPGSEPVAIRLGMYRNDPEAGFVNTPWLSLSLPPR